MRALAENADRFEVAFDADARLALIAGDDTYARFVVLVENLVIAYGNHDRCEDAVRLVDGRLSALLATQEGRDHFPTMMQSYTWAGVLTRDEALRRHVKDRFEALLAEHSATFDAHPAALDNMAAVYCKLGDRKAMFRMLEPLKKLRYPSLAGLVKDPHLVSMHSDPEFVAFFSKGRRSR